MNSLIPRFQRSYTVLVAGASLLRSPFLLLIRVYWGWAFFGTGKGKLLKHSDIADYFTSLHIPAPSLSAWMAGSVECFGGLLLLVGLASRLTCIPLIFTMIVAYATAEHEKLQAIFSDPDQFTGATPFLFLCAALIVFIFGPGAFSLDWLIGKFTWNPEYGNRQSSYRGPSRSIVS